jgi:pimeloyl-ACP methyl ester carboxylesterase
MSDDRAPSATAALGGGGGFPRWLAATADVIEVVATRRRARKPQVTPADVLGAEEVSFDDRSVAARRRTGWWLETSGATATVVLVHGFGATPADLAPIARHLVGRGHAVVMTDQRELPRLPTSAAELERDAPWGPIVDATGWVRDRPEAADGVVIIGHSMGGAATLAAAVREPDLVRGVVTLGAIADPRTTRMAGIPAVLNRRAADLMSKRLGRDVSAEVGVGAMRDLTCEVVVAHGLRDRVVPVRNARLLAGANSRATLLLVPDRGHAPAALFADIRQVVDDRLDRWLPAGTPDSWRG